jgi:hypothetical protein
MNTYYCKRIDGLSIDGNYDKADWSGIDEVSLVNTMTGSQPRLNTKVKAAWNDEFLYVAFSCEDDSINATMTEYNDEIYKEEVIEVFIDDDCDLKTYIEIEVNPLNTLLHYEAHNNLKGNVLLYARKEKKVFNVVLHGEDQKKWSAEIAIPMTEFTAAANIPPKPGDRWLVNFYRIKRPPNGEDEFTAWSPTVVRRYHTPQKFGQLIFTE